MFSAIQYSTIPVTQRRRFVRNALDRPREVGCFSIDASKQMHYDRRLMPYYIPRQTPCERLNLNVGYEQTVSRDHEDDTKIDHILNWIVHSRFEPVLNKSVDFVTFRGTIQKLLCTPYFKGEYDHWILCASRLDDAIYIAKVNTEATQQRLRSPSEREKRLSAWGFKFEQYMTADRPDGVPDVSSTTHEIEQFCIVVSNRIGKYNVIFRAEVDGTKHNPDVRRPRDTSHYIEIKTSKKIPNFRNSFPFKSYKSLKWWAQSVTVGIQENVCGFRDDNGFVRNIETFETEDLPHFGQQFWSPKACFNFRYEFLDHLKSIAQENDHRIVYKFEYYGGDDVQVTKMINPESEYQVIPDWYVEELKKSKSS